MTTRTTQSGIIETLAGNGEPGYAGDGGPAGAASLNEPKGLCVDREGNLYIADSENHVVRRVDRVTGIITTVAGVCPSGATGPAVPEPPVAAQAEEDEDPFADHSGDSTKAYTMNHRVRKVDAATGIITNVAGTGQARYSGDDGPAVSAAINEPTGLAVSDEALYIADQSNNRVRRVDLATGVITTVAGDGTAAYSGDQVSAVQASLAGPSGVALGGDGVVYVADTFNSRIRSVDPATGQIATVAGDGVTYRYQGPAEPSSPSLSRPAGIAVGSDGNVYMTDSDSHLIRVWNGRSKTISRLSGTGVAQFGGDGGDALAGSLSYPFGVAVDASGTVYVADTFNHRIRVLTATA